MSSNRRFEVKSQMSDAIGPLAQGDPANLGDILALAVTIARGAGAILREGINAIQAGETASIHYKSTPIDVVTEYDRRSEAYIVSALRAAFPSHAIVGEEGGEYAPQHSALNTEHSFEWQVDPLDGTTNFSHGFPIFSVSMGLIIDGQPSLGVVYSPVGDEMYAAALGRGATRNGTPIHVSKTASLGYALLVTGFPYDAHTTAEDNISQFMAFQRRTQAVRRIGSAALDLCLVACGQMDGYWEMKIRPHDIAGGIVIAREAGGVVTDFDGGDAMLETGRIVASNGLVHAEMIEVLGKTADGRPQTTDN